MNKPNYNDSTDPERPTREPYCTHDGELPRWGCLTTICFFLPSILMIWGGYKLLKYFFG